MLLGRPLHHYRNCEGVPVLIRLQLRVYYGLRGLTGKALKHAIKQDMRSIKLQGGEDNQYGIAGAIYYGDTLEGFRYWRDRNEAWPSDAL